MTNLPEEDLIDYSDVEEVVEAFDEDEEWYTWADCAPTSLADQGFGTTVLVLVGKEKTQYALHKDLLISASDYFKTLFSGPWKETECGIVELFDADDDSGKFSVAIFDQFARWLYSGRLYFVNLLCAPELLIRLWLLADHLQSNKLKNAVISSFSKMWYHYDQKRPGNLDDGVLASKYMPATRTLRQFLVYKYAKHAPPAFVNNYPEWDQDKELLRRELIVDIAIALAKLQETAYDIQEKYNYAPRVRKDLDMLETCKVFHHHEHANKKCTSAEMRSVWNRTIGTTEPRRGNSRSTQKEVTIELWKVVSGLSRSWRTTALRIYRRSADTGGHLR